MGPIALIESKTRFASESVVTKQRVFPALPVMVVDMLCQVLLQGFVDQAAHCTAAPIEKD